MIFFSKDDDSAIERVNELALYDKFYRNKVPVLSEKQIPHISGWKTYKLIRINRR